MRLILTEDRYRVKFGRRDFRPRNAPRHAGSHQLAPHVNGEKEGVNAGRTLPPSRNSAATACAFVSGSMERRLPCFKPRKVLPNIWLTYRRE